VKEHPAELAKTRIGEALGAVQDDPAAGSQLAALATTLAGAQRHLFAASRVQPRLPEAIAEMREAMENLARALQILQDLRSGSKAVEVAARAVASSLATLYAATQDAPRRPSRPPPPPPAPPDLRPQAPDADPVTLRGRPGPGAAPPPTLEDWRRKTVHLQLESAIDVHGDTQFFTGLSGSIDEGGIFIATFDQQPINAKVVVTFMLPNGRRVVTRGTVRWVREYNPASPDVVPGMGVRFLQLTPQDRSAIEEYLKQRPPLFYDE